MSLPLRRGLWAGFEACGRALRSDWNLHGDTHTWRSDAVKYARIHAGAREHAHSSVIPPGVFESACAAK